MERLKKLKETIPEPKPKQKPSKPVQVVDDDDDDDLCLYDSDTDSLDSPETPSELTETPAEGKS